MPVIWRRRLVFSLFGLFLLMAGTNVALATLAGSADWLQFVLGAPLPIGFACVGALIAWKQADNLVGWLCLGIGLIVSIPGGSYATYALVKRHGEIPGGEIGAAVDNVALPIAIFLVIFLILLFPDGRLPSHRWRMAGSLIAAAGALWTLAFAFAPGTFSNSFTTMRNPFGVGGLPGLFFSATRGLGYLFLVIALMAAAAALITRFRHARGELRQQLKWIAAAAAMLASFWLLSVVMDLLGLRVAANLVSTLGIVAFAAVPVAVGVAVFRYRLYDIDLVINRALVYGALAAFITLVYVAIVVGLGRLIGRGRGNDIVLSIGATAIVAFAFEPVRAWVQRLANRLVYGQRATPYEVMAGFADRMARTLSTEDVLARMAEAAARGVGAEAATVALELPDGSSRVTTWPPNGQASSATIRVDVAYRGERIGEIAVIKAATERLTPAEGRLLADLATQAGLVLHNLRLTTELQARLVELSAQAEAIRASRQRLVQAATSERQRLQATLQQSAERDLVGVASELDGVVAELDRDPAAAAATLEQLTAQTQRTLDGVRSLAHGIYPPLLRDQGLTAALRSQLLREARSLQVEAEGVQRYAPEVEAAVYFCCLEALTGVPGDSTVRLDELDGQLLFCVSGVESPNGRLQDIEDRIEAVGGSVSVTGSAITGRIPVAVMAQGRG